MITAPSANAAPPGRGDDEHPAAGEHFSLTGHILHEAESVDALAICGVRQSHEHARHDQPDEPGILALDQASPFRALFQGVRVIERALQANEIVTQIEHAGAGIGKERAEGRCRHACDRLEDVEVVICGAFDGLRVDLVIGDDRPERLPARRPEFILVDLVEQLTLVELDRAVEIASQLRPAQSRDLDLDGGRAFPPLTSHEVVKTAPTRFKTLEAAMVQDGVDLIVDHPIDRRHRTVQRCEKVLSASRTRRSRDPLLQHA